MLKRVSNALEIFLNPILLLQTKPDVTRVGASYSKTLRPQLLFIPFVFDSSLHHLIIFTDYKLRFVYLFKQFSYLEEMSFC